MLASFPYRHLSAIVSVWERERGIPAIKRTIFVFLFSLLRFPPKLVRVNRVAPIPGTRTRAGISLEVGIISRTRICYSNRPMRSFREPPFVAHASPGHEIRGDTRRRRQSWNKAGKVYINGTFDGFCRP